MIVTAHAVTEMATTTVADGEEVAALARARLIATAARIVIAEIGTTAAAATTIDASLRGTRLLSPPKTSETEGQCLFSSSLLDCVLVS